MIFKKIFWILPLLLLACSSETADNPSKQVAQPEYKKVEYHNDYQIGSYTSSTWGLKLIVTG